MSNQNYGPIVSGYLDPDGRAWELPIFQQGKAVLDRELNLESGLSSGGAQQGLTTAMPSGWLNDPLTTGAITPELLTSAVANELQWDGTLRAHVRGWLVPVAHTASADGTNRVALPAAPIGAGTRRTDLVVLEVWRKLVSPAPSTDGKSPAGRIWWNGNVKIDAGQDLTLNFPDDILAPALGVESTKRVQVQYRLRVVSGVDVFAYPYGLDDPTVVANTVPPAAASPDGTPTLFPYVNQAPNGDAGLWRAGDGNPANTLGTVDGYMYAIPLAAVFRRNRTAFARNTNQNGGVASPGPSDRPDGLFYDMIVPRDVLDLRHAVRPQGWDYREVLDKQVQNLLDNVLQTEVQLTSNGAGMAGHTVVWADEIGITNANGGDGVITGDTPGGDLIGQFDAVHRAFSDRATLETVVVKVNAPGGGWVPGSVVTVQPSALEVPPYAAFNWTSYNPANVLFLDVTEARWVGSAVQKNYEALTHFTSITGFGAMPVSALTITVNTIPAGLTTEPLYLTLTVAYPTGQGLTRTPVGDFGAAGITVNNPGQLPAGAPVNFGAFSGANGIDAPHREVNLQYITTNQTATFQGDSSGASSTFTLRERAQAIVSVTKNGVPIVGGVNLDATGRLGTFTNPVDNTVPGDVLVVTYTALRPLPQNNEQLTIYYEARASQTARGALIGTTLTVIPRLIDAHMHVITVGTGSQDEGYPYPVASTQVGGVYPGSLGAFTGEHELAAPADLAVTDFSATTGFLRLPVMVPYVPSPDEVTYTRGPGDTDIEGRTFFPTAALGYVPNAYAQQLSDAKRHRNFLGVLAELPADSALGRRGQLVLVILLREGLFDANNSVAFDSNLAQNTTTAAVFRVKGHPLNKRL